MTAKTRPNSAPSVKVSATKAAAVPKAKGALEIMSTEQVRRLPVCNEDKELVGIVALADAAHRDPDKREVAEALAEISEPSGLHCQPPVFA